MDKELTQEEIALIRLLQEEFPLCERPFAVLGEELGLKEEQVLEMTRRLTKEGKLKRIAAALYHRKAGFSYNSLVAWEVPEERLDEAGRAAASFPRVTHCYARKPSPAFCYNLYTMVHETSQERLDALIEELRQCICPLSFASLPTVRELKKKAMRYFL